MNIGVLSGKGGTGKTLISTNLALSMGATYVDCDVEEPNGFIFLKPEDIKSENVYVDNPLVDKDKCILCGKCVEFCEFNALAKTKEIFIFEKLCHSCGGCKIVCPTGAMGYQKRSIGAIDQGVSGEIKCIRGILDVGEVMAVPLIEEVINSLDKNLNIVDCSPGTSCNVVASIENLDYAILVAEPTEFGLHDFKRALELCRIFNVPSGVIVNMVMDKDNIISRYCEENNVEVLGTIPFDREIAKVYSRGEMICEIDEYKNIFTDLIEKLGDVR